MEKKTKNIDLLDEDPIIQSQRYCCFSFLSSRNVKNCKRSAFKFRGAFATEEEAKKHAEEIQQKLDSDFHVFVGEGFKWMEFDPDPESVETQEYKEKEINGLMKNYKEQLMLKKQHADERKKKKLEEAMVENEELTKRNKVKERLQKKHANKQKQLTSESEVKEQLAQIDAEEKDLESQQKNFNELTTGLQKLQETYAKLLDKTNVTK
jgi:DNA repair exonuclease SbcCD ATPase subunit